jgi:hypothetical protein
MEIVRRLEGQTWEEYCEEQLLGQMRSLNYTERADRQSNDNQHDGVRYARPTHRDGGYRSN